MALMKSARNRRARSKDIAESPHAVVRFHHFGNFGKNTLIHNKRPSTFLEKEHEGAFFIAFCFIQFRLVERERLFPETGAKHKLVLIPPNLKNIPQMIKSTNKDYGSK